MKILSGASVPDARSEIMIGGRKVSIGLGDNSGLVGAAELAFDGSRN